MLSSILVMTANTFWGELLTSSTLGIETKIFIPTSRSSNFLVDVFITCSL